VQLFAHSCSPTQMYREHSTFRCDVLALYRPMSLDVVNSLGLWNRYALSTV